MVLTFITTTFKKENKMSEIYLGKPSQKIIDWCKAKYPPASTPTPLYFGSINGSHIHETNVSILTGYFDWDESIQTGKQLCLKGEAIDNAQITYLSGDNMCTCIEISYQCFAGSECNIVSAVIPTVTKIRSEAFMANETLTYLELNNVNYIGSNAFSTTPINNLNFPNITSIDNIEDQAFNGMNYLSSLHLEGLTVDQVQSKARDWQIPSGCTVYCKDGEITIE